MSRALLCCSLHTANDIYANVAVDELQMKVDILQARKAAILARSDSPPGDGGAGGSGTAAQPRTASAVAEQEGPEVEVLTNPADEEEPDALAWACLPSVKANVVTAHVSRDAVATDVDGDGHVDILSASWNDDKIAWYKNNGNASSFTIV